MIWSVTLSWKKSNQSMLNSVSPWSAYIHDMMMERNYISSPQKLIRKSTDIVHYILLFLRHTRWMLIKINLPILYGTFAIYSFIFDAPKGILYRYIRNKGWWQNTYGQYITTTQIVVLYRRLSYIYPTPQRITRSWERQNITYAS